MKVYKAKFVLGTYGKEGLTSFFDFEELEDGEYSKTEYGYFKSDGWLSEILENKISACDSICHVISEKYFDRELAQEELSELEVKMKKECIEALKKKKQRLINELDNQIDYIQKQL